MRLIIILFSILLLTCTSEDASQVIVIDGAKDINLSFESTLKTIEEGQSLEVKLILSKAVPTSGTIDISFSSENAVYGEDFTSTPVVTNGVVNISYAVGAESIAFNLNTIVDEDIDTEVLNFNISSAPKGVKFDSDVDLVVNIEDEPQASDEVLSVVTWNIEQYPKRGSTTINAVADIVEQMDADIIALQEIDDIPAFNTLVASLAGWEGKLYNVRGGIELAYLYRTSEITSFSILTTIFDDDSESFPRQPVLVTATHRNGLEVTLINIHLKCCGVTGTTDANRRESASKALEEYIDANMPNDNVIVLGDWNDDINHGPFDNFLSNGDNYSFADFDIGSGSKLNWSYPSWPSHLDHILITNELTDNLISSETLKLDASFSGYINNVSDHRPVVAKFSN